MIQFTDKVQLIRTLTFIVVFKQFKFIFAFEIGAFLEGGKAKVNHKEASLINH